MPRDGAGAEAAESVSASQTTIRCHRCSQFIGESAEPVEFVGVVRDSDLVELIQRPRSVWRCRCKWMNIFKPLAKAA